MRGLRLDAAGTVLDAQPLDLMTGSRPDVAGRGDGFFVVAAGAAGTHAVRVGGDGTIIDGTPIALDAGPTDHAAAAPYGALWVAAWERSSVDGGDVAASFVVGAGSVIGPLEVTAPGDGVAARRPAVAAADTVLFVWQDDRGSDLDLYGRRLSAGVTFTDPAGGVPLITAPGTSAMRRSSGTGCASTWPSPTRAIGSTRATGGWASTAGLVARRRPAGRTRRPAAVHRRDDGRRAGDRRRERQPVLRGFGLPDRGAVSRRTGWT